MLQKLRKEKGFTLIELMVVIAIIAILATVVLVSLQSAREAAQNSNRIAATTQVRSLAEIYYAQDLDYEEMTTPPSQLRDLICLYGIPGNYGITCTDDEVKDAEALEIHVSDAADDYQDYCAEIELVGDKGFFCVDSDLRAVEHTGTGEGTGRRCTGGTTGGTYSCE